MSEPAAATTAVATVTPKKTVTSRRGVTVAKPKPVETLSFDEQILRAAGDKRIDVAKLRELTDLRRQLRLEDAEEAFNEALRSVQAEIGVIEPDKKNGSTNSMYATLYAVEQRLRGIYGRYGFSLSFDTAESPAPNTVRVVGYLSRGGFTRRYQRDVEWTTKGPKGNDVCTVTHAQAGAETYGKRYLELSAFHITVGEDVQRADRDGNTPTDDDGFPGDKPMLLNLAQIERLRDLMKKVGCAESNFLRHVKHDRIETILAASYDRCVNLINSYRGPRQ